MSLIQSDKLNLARLLVEFIKTQGDGVDVNRHEIAELNRDFEYSATNKIPSIFFQFEWTIENYNVQCIEGCESPDLELPDVTLTFFLKRVSLPDNRQHFDVLSVYSSSTTISLSGSVQFYGETFPVNYAIVSKHETILKIPLITKSLKQLKAFFNITVHYLDKKNFTFTKQKHGVNVLNEDQYQQELQKTVQCMFRSSRFSDVRFESRPGSIDAHKNILSARSPVFASMFQHSTVESSVMVIDVQDIPYDILEHFVGFLYGHIPNFETIRDLNKLCELYCASDKYQVLSLRKLCGQVLVGRISEENVCLLMEHFIRYDDEEFLTECVRFCCMELNNDKSDKLRKLVLADPRFKSLVFQEMTEPKYGSVTEDT